MSLKLCNLNNWIVFWLQVSPCTKIHQKATILQYTQLHRIIKSNSSKMLSPYFLSKFRQAFNVVPLFLRLICWFLRLFSWFRVGIHQSLLQQVRHQMVCGVRRDNLKKQDRFVGYRCHGRFRTSSLRCVWVALSYVLIGRR